LTWRKRAEVAHLDSVYDALWRDVNIQNSKIFLQMVPNERPSTVDHEADLEISTLEGNQVMLRNGRVEITADEATVPRAVVHHLLGRLDVIIYHHAPNGARVEVVTTHDTYSAERQTRGPNNLRQRKKIRREK